MGTGMGTGTGTHLRPLPGNPDVLAGRQLAALNLGGPFAGVAVGAALLLLALVHADHLAVPRRLAARLHALLAGNKSSPNAPGTAANPPAPPDRVHPSPTSPSEPVALGSVWASRGINWGESKDDCDKLSLMQGGAKAKCRDGEQSMDGAAEGSSCDSKKRCRGATPGQGGEKGAKPHRFVPY